MRIYYMYLCDICGFSREKSGVCPHCKVPLTEYNKEIQHEYQVDMEEAMRGVSEYQWHV